MSGWTYRGSHPVATCVVLPDIYGPSPFYHYVTAELARAGYEATLLDYFVREGPLADKTREGAFARRSMMNENTAIADISTAIDAVANGNGDGSGRIGLLGFCLSGTYAWDLATMRSDLAIVTYYGFPEGPGGQTKSDAPRPIDVAAEMTGPILSFSGRPRLHFDVGDLGLWRESCRARDRVPATGLPRRGSRIPAGARRRR